MKCIVLALALVAPAVQAAEPQATRRWNCKGVLADGTEFGTASAYDMSECMESIKVKIRDAKCTADEKVEYLYQTEISGKYNKGANLTLHCKLMKDAPCRALLADGSEVATAVGPGMSGCMSALKGKVREAKCAGVDKFEYVHQGQLANGKFTKGSKMTARCDPVAAAAPVPSSTAIVKGTAVSAMVPTIAPITPAPAGATALTGAPDAGTGQAPAGGKAKPTAKSMADPTSAPKP